MARADGLVLGMAAITGVVFGWWGIALVGLGLSAACLHGPRGAWWPIAAVLAMVAVGAVRSETFYVASRSEPLAGSTRVSGIVASIPIARGNGDRFVLRVERVLNETGEQQTDARVVVYTNQDQRITVGDVVTIGWEYEPLAALPPGYGSYVRSQNAVGSATAWSLTVTDASDSPFRFLVSLRRTVVARFAKLVPGNAGALMTGIVTGDDSGLSASAREAFRTTSTGHVTAVSGSNVAMLVALWARLAGSRARRRRIAMQVTIIVAVWLYCVATGLEPSALRASTVASLVVLGVRFGRGVDAMTILAVVTGALLLVNPILVLSLGFWLSTAASAAIIGSFRAEPGDYAFAAIRSALVALTAAQFATLPIVVWSFGTIAPLGLLANLAIAPLMAVAFPLCFGFTVIAFVPFLGPALAFIPRAVCDLPLFIVERLATVAAPIQPAPTVTGIGLIAAACYAVVLGMGQDTRRWLPRGNALLRHRPSSLALTSGLITGMAMGLLVAIWT